MSWVGTSIRRREDPALLEGRASFTADIAVPYGAVAFVRSPVAAGTISGIEIPDDAVVFAAEDLDDVDALAPVLNRPDYVTIPQHVFATDHVSYVGQPVAMVIAATREEAEDLAEAVFVLALIHI